MRGPALLFFGIIVFVHEIHSERLNEWIEHYEGLSYDAQRVHNKHIRVKRDLDDHLFIAFRAHNRDFRLRLRRDVSVFSNDVSIESHDQTPLTVDLSHIYSGHLIGDKSSYVFGSVRDGVFQGRIESGDGRNFYVERSRYHNISAPFHSIIYDSQDVKIPPRISHCGSRDPEIKQWMESVQNAPVVEESFKRSKRDVYTPFKPIVRPRPISSDFYQPYIRHQMQQQQQLNIPYLLPIPSIPSPQRRVCNLYIQTDTFLWEHIKSIVEDPDKVREEISSLIAQHIEAASRIYKTTDFQGIKDIKFAVQRIRINDSTACDGYNRLTNPYCAANLDSSTFLNLNSLSNHDNFCLAYVWTYRDFNHGTLGLAWVASVAGASGGICEKYKTYNENVNGRTENVKRSLNTGIITFLNHHAKVPLKVSEITFAHEIGHNFGSPHDYPPECQPGGHAGNYLMYSSATQGHQENNNKFSPCSIRNISAVLHAVFKGEFKENCFQEYEGPFCGNKIVEGNEECDCGYDERECMESCCYPRENAEHRPGCTRRPGARCSPSQGPCCTNDCSFEVPGLKCKHESDCTLDAFCNGHTAHCPLPEHKANKTECNNGTQVCWSGECSGSICNKYGLEECYLSSAHTKDVGKLCEVACQEWEKPETCKSTYEIERMRIISGIKRRPGSPCDNLQGYCDVFQKCRNVDAEGPLARLKRLIFNQQALRTVRQWVTFNWWAMLLMLLSIVIVMGCFIRCCAVHTPSSNPRMPPALRITDTLRRPSDTFRRNKRRRSNGNYHHPGHGGNDGPPPPYPGDAPAPSAPPAGPSHGYGHGRGHYNRSHRHHHGQHIEMKGNPRHERI